MLASLLVILCCIPIFMNPIGDDEGWFLYGAKRILHHSSPCYGTDLPLLYYVDVPLVWATHLLHCSVAIPFNLFILCLAILSASLSWRLLGRLFDSEHPLVQGMITLFLLAVVLLLPLRTLQRNDFGEREHLLLILTVPYLIVCVFRGMGKQLESHLLFYSGILAAAGMALKPNFLLLWIFLEVYLCGVCRAGAPWKRTESRVIGLLLLAYAVVTIIFFGEYIQLMRWAVGTYGAFNSPVSEMVDAGLNTAIALIFFLIVQPCPVNPQLLGVLLCSILAFLVNALMQGNASLYHFYPANALSMLAIVTVVISPQRQELEDSSRLTPVGRPPPSPGGRRTRAERYKRSIRIAGLSLGVLLLWQRGFSFLNTLFVLNLTPLKCLLLYALLQLAVETGGVSATVRRLVVKLLALGMIFYTAAEILYVIYHNFPPDAYLILISLGISFGFARIAQTMGPSKPLWMRRATAALALGVILTAGQAARYTLHSQKQLNADDLWKLVHIVNTQAPNRRIIVFSSVCNPVCPLINYSGAELSSRVGDLRMLPGLYTNVPANVNPFPYHQRSEMGPIERFLVDHVVQDMKDHPPDLVIVGGPFAKIGFKSDSFNYVDYFAQDTRFRKIWSRYRLLVKFSKYQVFKRQA